MKTRVIQDDSDDPTTFEDRAEAPVEQKRSTKLAARMARWAYHRKIVRDPPADDDEAARRLELVPAPLARVATPLRAKRLGRGARSGEGTAGARTYWLAPDCR
jgi:hypothetical protein